MKRYAFSLVEALVAMALVGIAIVSLVAASSSFTKVNGAGRDMSTAEFLIEQIRELTAPLPVTDPQTGAAAFGPEEAGVAGYDDIDDFDGATFSPPISAGRGSLSAFSAFSQQVTVQNVSAGNFDQVVADHGSSFVKVTVEVSMNSESLGSVSWIRANIGN
jgi:type II secretory pathway pseudopilin PulG